jgi:hypothetical protein
MIFGMATYTFVHVLISLADILSGFVVLYGLLAASRMLGWAAVFLVTALATDLTGFGFPFHGVDPAIVVGIVSTIVLAAAIAALYAFRLSGPWRVVYVIGAVLTLYLNVFVLVAQAFQKVPALHALAPKGSEPPFAIAQGIVLLAFIALGVLAVRRFHPAPVGLAAAVV